MSKHSLPSIEQFAAYLDGNLPQSEMQQFSQLAEHDSALNQLLDASSMVDSTLAGFSDSDLQLPPEMVGSDFELPEIDDFENFSFVDDSFAENDGLYQHEGIDAGRQHRESHSSLVDEIFDDLDSNMTDDGDTIETDVDIDTDIFDDDIDTDLFDLDM